MTRQMELACMNIKMVQSTTVHGKMIFSMALEKKHGQIVLSTEVNTLRVKSMEEERMSGQMGADMTDIGKKTRLKGLACTNGWTDASIKDSGLTTTWME